MPTGYTYFIENGDISTGAEFLKKCIRNFGCCIDQRDDPLTEPLKTDIHADSYHKKCYEEAVNRLENFRKRTSDEMSDDIINAKQKELSGKKLYLSHQELLRDRYLKVRNEVEAWVPPTPDHEGIKRFALDQIDMCIPTEKDINKLREQVRDLDENCNSEIDESDIGKYIIEETKFLERDIEYYKKKMIEDEERAANRTKFIKDFLSSL